MEIRSARLLKVIQILSEINWQSDITIHEGCYDTRLFHTDI